MKGLLIELIKNSFLNKYIDELKPKIKPLIDYWVRLSSREKQLISIGMVFILIFLAVSVTNAAISYKNDLETHFIQSQQYRLDAQMMAKEYQSLSQMSSNEFSTVSTDRIKGDITQVLDIKEPDVTLNDKLLIINVPSAKFESIMLLLDQLRKSYGLFPDKLKIIRLSQSGYVSFSATFIVEK